MLRATQHSVGLYSFLSFFLPVSFLSSSAHKEPNEKLMQRTAGRHASSRVGRDNKAALRRRELADTAGSFSSSWINLTTHFRPNSDFLPATVAVAWDDEIPSHPYPIFIRLSLAPGKAEVLLLAGAIFYASTGQIG